MHALKRTLIFLIGLISLPFIIGLFLPRTYTVQREIVIQQPNSGVFTYLLQLKDHSHYGKATTLDPNMYTYFLGNDGKVGFTSGWKSSHEEIGEGEQEIKKIIPNKRIELDLRYKKPFPGEVKAYLITDSISPTSTRVTWRISGNLSYPMHIFSVFLDLEKSIGEDLAFGLVHLKGLIEKNSAEKLVE